MTSLGQPCIYEVKSIKDVAPDDPPPFRHEIKPALHVAAEDLKGTPA